MIKTGVIDQLLDKFGYGPALTKGQLTNALLHNQVFKREQIKDVVCQLQHHIETGSPPVLHFTAEVQDNTWWGITGGWNVDIVVVYLEHSKNFEEALPERTRWELFLDSSGEFADYPAYATSAGGGTNAQYNLLAATSEYYVRQNRHLFHEVLR